MIKVRKTARIRNQCNQDTTWESDKTQLDITNKEPRGQPFPSGYHRAALNRCESLTHTQGINNTSDPQKKYRLGTVSKNILLEGLNQFRGANPALNSDVDQDTFGRVTKHKKHDSQEVSSFPAGDRPRGYKEQTRQHNTHQHEAYSTKTIHKRSTALERSVKIILILLEGLKPWRQPHP